MVKPKKEYESIESYTIARYKNDYILKLDMNENTLGCSPKVMEKLKNLSPEVLSQYPTYGEIEEKIATTLAIPVNQVAVTNGGDAGINAIYITYVSENDEIIYVVPTYVMYKLDAMRQKAKIIQVPYREKWVYPTDDVIAKISDKTRLIIICSPANPTGDMISEDCLCKVIEAAPNAIVLLDEAYWRFTSKENKSFKYLIDRYSNLVIMHTFSKDYGLAGLRIGYLISQEQNLEHIRKSMDPFAVNNIAVEAALVALEDQDFVQQYVDAVTESKPFFCEAIKSISNEIYPGEANFSFFYVGSRQEWYHSKLLKKGIKIRRYPTNPMLNGYLRITLGTKVQMQTFMDAIKNYDGIVFDIDGVLIDESISYRKAIQLTYEFFTGKTVTQEEIQNYKNQSGFINDWVLTKFLVDKENKTYSLEEITDKFQEFYFDNGKGLISKEKLLVNTEVIQKLSENYKLAVFTGRPRQEAEIVLEKEGVLKYFQKLVCCDDLPEGKAKPDPEGLNRIISEFNSNNLLYVGDMPDDMLAASRAGIDCAGILPPQDKSDALKELLFKNSAIEVYSDLNEAVYNIFGEL